MQLNLKKPIVFFDLETTGIDITNDRIIEISMLKVHPDGQEEQVTYLVNPEQPIDPRSIEIHGITDEKVKDKPSFKELAKQIAQFFEGCDIAGYNSNKFDVPMLAEEFLRAEVDFDLKKHQLVDVQVIFHKMEQRTLEAAYRFYCKKTLEDAHSAAADTKATYEILKAQLDYYEELENEIPSLSKFSAHKRNADFAGRIVYNEDGIECFNFGKHKGKPVEEVLQKEPGYYGWIINSDFPRYTKKVLTMIKLRNFNK